MSSIFLFAVAVCTGLCMPARAAADPIRIGAIFPLTGNSAVNGQSLRDGVLLAVDEINKRGGVNGNKIELVIEDSKSDPQAAAAAFNKIEAGPPPLFYVSMLSNVGVALAPLADAKKVILVGVSTSALAFTKGHDMVYRYFPLAQGEISPLVRILQNIKAKKLGIIYSNEEYGTELERLLRKSFEDMGGTVASQSFVLGDTDMSRQIASLKAQDAIVVATLGASLTNTVRQLREAKYGGSVLVPSSGAVPAYFLLPEMQEVYVSAPIIYNPGYLYAREASDRFVARYKTPITVYAANGYDFIKLISGLLEDRPLTREGVHDALAAGFQYSGVFGPVLVKPGEHEMGFPMYPAQILNNTLSFR